MTMTCRAYRAAVSVLCRAWRAGVRLSLIGDGIRFAGRASPDLLGEIREHKPEIIRAMQWHAESDRQAYASVTATESED